MANTLRDMKRLCSSKLARRQVVKDSTSMRESNIDHMKNPKVVNIEGLGLWFVSWLGAKEDVKFLNQRDQFWCVLFVSRTGTGREAFRLVTKFLNVNENSTRWLEAARQVTSRIHGGWKIGLEWQPGAVANVWAETAAEHDTDELKRQTKVMIASSQTKNFLLTSMMAMAMDK